MQSILGMLLIATFAVVVGVVLWLSFSEKDTRIELSAVDLCPKDQARRPPALYAVLVDQTDPLNELARASVANEVLQRLQLDLEGGGDSPANRLAKVEVWTFTNGGAGKKDNYRVGNTDVQLTKVLSMCNPGSPAKWDYLYRNVDVVKRQHQRFYASLKQILDQSLAFPEAPRSPIIEALYGIGAKVFSAPEVSDAKKQLILVSDLVQGTQDLNFFQSGYKPNFASWRSTPNGRQTLPELRDVAVTAIVIPGTRPDLQTENLLGFWGGLFQAAGAHPTFIRKP
ncbi:MAG: hypothetical protein LCH95_08925 [Proteobacteria bacterium]|nr:hypothetical protein [Pseudomonadota bacterium]